MNKKLVIYSLLLLQLMFLTGCRDISMSAKSVKIELGDVVSEDILDYVYVEPNMQQKVYKEAELNVLEIESMIVGEYNAVVKYGEKTLVVPVIVEDTTPPAIKEKKISFREGDKVIADDLVEVDDFSETSLYLLDSTSEMQLDFATLRPGMTVIVKAVDKSGNETIAEITPQVLIKNSDGIPEARSYESTDSFPYGKLELVDDDTYEVIKDAYSVIKWDAEFETGHIEQYDFYKKKYKELLDGEVKFLKHMSSIVINSIFLLVWLICTPIIFFILIKSFINSSSIFLTNQFRRHSFLLRSCLTGTLNALFFIGSGAYSMVNTLLPFPSYRAASSRSSLSITAVKRSPLSNRALFPLL